jgi:CRISPR-associated endonuclease/helicase Cas3
MHEPTQAIPSFGDFYREVHQRDPLPWQEALASQVHNDGWPSGVGVPTGLGKTAAIDIAVWALAAEAVQEPQQRCAATRVWYVVNRRLLVDEAFDHGCVLAQLLADPTAAEPIRAVARALREIAAMGREDNPLHVGLVRGGAPRTSQVPDPSMPALLFATVPMYASRWLFEAYGASRGNRPIEAALAGIDSLVLLDESHLCQPLRDLAEPLSACDPAGAAGLLPPQRTRPCFVELTATGSEDAFNLSEADHAHPVVRRRLDARKPTTLVPTSKRRMPKELAQQTAQVVADCPASATVVFVNTPSRAREVHRQLQHELNRRRIDADPVLLTGRVREFEGEALRRRLLDPQQGSPATDAPEPRPSPLVVVATQTLEVGANLDFDHLITETAGPRALVQRFGRLNRLGVRNDRARAVVCHASDDMPSRVYGEQPQQVWASLSAVGDDGDLDLGPGRITELVGTPDERAPRTGEILPAHLWEWVKTSCPPPGRAPIEPFIDGIESPLAQVTVAWRTLRGDATLLSRVQAEDGQELTSRLFPRLRSEETLELPLAEARDALADVVVHRVVDDGMLEVVPRDGRGLRLRPGDQLVIPCAAGMADRHGWEPLSSEDVLDLSPLASGVLPLSTELLANLGGPLPDELVAAVDRLLAVDEETGEPLDRSPESIEVLVAHLRTLTLREPSLQPRWLSLIEGLDRRQIIDEPGVVAHLRTERASRQWLSVASDALDELSFDASSDDLLEHGGSVADLAARTAQHLGLPAELVDVVERAGSLHDVGKADPRFQRWLDPHGHRFNQLLAKSSYAPVHREAYRIAAGWPRAGRHEALSVRLAQARLEQGRLTEDDDLLMHLIASHHGEGRPSLPVTEEATPGTVVELEHDGEFLKADADLSRPDWDQPARFRRVCERYGYWGVALLEAVVRKADHAASNRACTEHRGGATR